ncbi:phage/plasmid primase, P4 family [Actinomyces minihominis]|uniref:phage/plasmid primase, P4 family n=1 Tax=Actinomyces minihominis TaxID=2002838 RepID=UPI000C085C5E|nr:phage/plasmid primase, P4 family [Actinomyces minihominis]
MIPMTLFCADVAGHQHNKHYPRKLTIASPDELADAVRWDHVAAQYQGNLRGNANYETADCLVMDVDNDHSEDPEDWIAPDDLAALLPGVALMTATSRNHMRPKGIAVARPRFHVYFPITSTADAKEYAGLKRLLAGRFEFFDRQALDAGRFIFGTHNPEVTMVDAAQTVDAWLDAAQDQDLFAQFDADTQAIGEGSRNSTMSRFAARVLIRYGNTGQARELFDRKADLCRPPLGDAELEVIWRSATRFATKIAADPDYLSPEAYANLTSLRPRDMTDVGQAATMAEEYADRLRYSPATDWLVYNGAFWEESAPDAQGVAQDLTDRQLEEAESLVESVRAKMDNAGITALMGLGASRQKLLGMLTPAQMAVFREYEDAETYRKYALKRRESKSITACLKEARPVMQTTPAALDADPYLLNTPTATYDLRQGLSSGRNHAAADLLTKQTSIDPSIEGADIWGEALSVFFQSDPELIGYVQRIVGLAAIGKVMVEALVIAYGDGRNGKSTFWNTVARVLGSYAGNMSADVLTVGAMRNVKPELAEAKGKRLLIAAESEEGVRLSTSVVKQLASTDQVYAEKKYKAPFAYTPSHQLVLYTNHLPRVGAMDTGIWRRLIVVPFEAKIQGKSDIKNYADHLYDNAGGAILAWIMEGARLIHAEHYKLNPPRQVVEASAAYQEENNWFAQFLEDCCEVGSGLEERGGPLYAAYREWAKRTSGWARPMIDFNAVCEQLGYTRHRTKRGVMVNGLQLRSEFDGLETAPNSGSEF